MSLSHELVDCLIDVGGTNTRVAVRSGEDLFGPVLFPTSRLYVECLGTIKSQAEYLAQGRSIDRVIAGVPTLLSPEKDTPIIPSAIPDWCGRNVVRDLQDYFAARDVYLENDTALVGLGEATYGAAIGYPIVAYITVSTGTNGVRIVNRSIDHNVRGFELAGQKILVREKLETIGRIISGYAVAERHGRPPESIDAESSLWIDLAFYTAILLHTVLLYWSPHAIVLGGSMFKSPGIRINRVRYFLNTMQEEGRLPAPPILPAALGDYGGIYGGIAFLNQFR